MKRIFAAFAAALVLGLVGQVGLWSIGLYSPELVRDVVFRDYRRQVVEQVSERNGDAAAVEKVATLEKLALDWGTTSKSEPDHQAVLAAWKAESDGFVGRGTLLQDVGSFFGAPFCTWIAVRFGRRWAFEIETMGTLENTSNVGWCSGRSRRP